MIEQITQFLNQELFGNITLSCRKHDKYKDNFEIYIIIEEGYFELQFRHSLYEKDYFSKDEMTYIPMTEENIQEAAIFVNNILKERYLN